MTCTIDLSIDWYGIENTHVEWTELCLASRSIGSNQLEAANVTGNGIAEAGEVYT
jgi:hypothetical protein